MQLSTDVEPTLEIEIRCDGEVEPFVFADFPVYIGRDESCELRLPYTFVSRRHARIEREGDGFVLVDEGSRNGISHDGRRLEPEERLVLLDQAEFSIETVVARVRFREPTLPMEFREPTNDNATSLYEKEQVVPEVIERASVMMEEYRAARAAALGAIERSMGELPDYQRAPMLQHLVKAHPELAFDPAFICLLDTYAVDVPTRHAPEAKEQEAEESRAALDLNDACERLSEAAARRELHRLARAYLPDAPPPDDEASLSRFVAGIDRTLRTFLNAKAEIEFAYRCESGDASLDRGQERTRLLARELLDWRVDTGPAVARLASDLMEYLAHNAALVADVESAMNGIVGTLSPAAIEWASKGSRWHGPFWARTLWREFAKRYQQIKANVDERLGQRFIRVNAALRGARSAPALPSPRAGSSAPASDADPEPGDFHWPFTSAAALE